MYGKILTVQCIGIFLFSLVLFLLLLSISETTSFVVIDEKNIFSISCTYTDIDQFSPVNTMGCCLSIDYFFGENFSMNH